MDQFKTRSRNITDNRSEHSLLQSFLSSLIVWQPLSIKEGVFLQIYLCHPLFVLKKRHHRLENMPIALSFISYLVVFLPIRKFFIFSYCHQGILSLLSRCQSSKTVKSVDHRIGGDNLRAKTRDERLDDGHLFKTSCYCRTSFEASQLVEDKILSPWVKACTLGARTQ